MMLTYLLLTACSSEQTQPPKDWIWEGWVYGDIPTEDTPGLVEGAVEVRSLDGTVLAEGYQSDPDQQARWTVDLSEEAEGEIEMRISGPEHTTTVWRTQAPTAQAYWYAGSLFAAKALTLGTFWQGLSELEGEALGLSQGAHLYGEPLPLNDADTLAWTGATITVYDGAGQLHPAITLATDEAGELVPSDTVDGPITAFAATDLAPGPVRLVVDSSDGRSVVMDYNAEAGDLLSAFAFTLSE
jgi:hypothetical protein